MPSSSLWMSAGSLAVASFLSPVAAGSPSSKSGSYSLLEAWQGESFFDYFDFFDAPDPTNGYVTYVNKTSAESAGLIDITSSGSVYVGVDHTSVLDPNGAGRESVRLDSKRFYEQGLYIVDIEHMPGSICGLWPAFWSVGPSWPEDGEIDIIEGVNTHENNEIVLHTSGTCTVTSDDMTGNLTSSECGEASGTIGCVVEAENGTYGTPLNKQGGGVYAMEWTTEFIKIWFFPRKAIPESITKGNPDPSTFGTPMGNMQGGCDVEKRFTAQKFILDTTFCGDWAGGVFGESGCPMSDSSSPIKSCVNYVAENPAVYKEAYWEINSIKVYQAGSKTDSSASMVPDSPASSLTATLDLSLGGDKTTSRPEKTSDTTEATFAFETTSKPETSVTQTAAARETTTAPDTTAPETTVPEPNLPKTTVTVTNAVRKTSAISEATTAFPETDVPETTAVPKTSAVDETTTAVPETDVPQASAVEPTPTYHHSATEIGGFQTTLKSTMYVTSRTTICPDAEASSFSTAGAGKTDSAATVTDTAAGTAAVSTPTETTTVPTSTVNVGKIVDIYPSVATSTPAAVISKSAENAATSLVDAPSEKIPAATATSGNSPSGVDGIAHSSAPSTSNAPATTYNHPDTGTSAWPDIPTQSISIHSVSVTSSWSAVPTQSNSVVTSARTSTPVLATGPSSSADGSGPVFTGTASKVSFSILSAIAAVAAVILV